MKQSMTCRKFCQETTSLRHQEYYLHKRLLIGSFLSELQPVNLRTYFFECPYVKKIKLFLWRPWRLTRKAEVQLRLFLN